ncbi:MAG: 4a-hydroxytetrahydrobiopterin dehydratase [Magnetovibrio sp.]|nr:4a-hydroxytetrahydrobiopterin dehydratase [Magnetovibrio sp.]
MTVLMTSSEIRQALDDLDGWAQCGDTVQKTFKFPDFKAAFAFMTACALKAEQMNHHPDWSNVYATVNVSLSTHDAGGITTKDIELATFMNAQT